MASSSGSGWPQTAYLTFQGAEVLSAITIKTRAQGRIWTLVTLETHRGVIF